ncbi:MAG: AAA family ATPase, partial [Desulfobacula sp.]|nr:AAA family ATPase [Desulfobacula sp.]
MIISEIIINNFKVYNGTHVVKFKKPEGDEKNITIIAGQNGFGKTSFLTALIWGLYGKMIVDVELSYKKAIYEIGGYKNYLLSILNNELISCDDERLSFYVQLEISNIYIPSVPCSKILIRREYFIKKDKEVTTILIDGFRNELANEVGADIFINDYVLPREIAKFFFFDAEKIVSLAEIKTDSEKRQLSLAYSDILGIRKYETLKYNLENVRTKLKRKSADIKQKEKIETIQLEIEEIKKLIEFNNNKIYDTQKEIEEKRNLSDEFQEKLIREGNNITVEDLKDLKALRDQLREENIKIKNRLKDLLDLAPFAISGKKLKEAYNQLIAERNSKQQFVDERFLQNKLSKIQLKVVNEIDVKKIDKSLKDELYRIIDQAFKSDSENKSIGKVKVLLEFSDVEENEFIAIFNNIRKSFNSIFKHIVKEEKNNRLFLFKTNRKIQQAESKGTDLVSRKYKDEKQKIDNKIKQLIIEKQKLHEEVGSYQNQLSVKSKLVSELIKKVRLVDIDDKKDEIT